MLLKVKRYLHSNNIELSDLNDKELDELARGIAELFLQQEKGDCFIVSDGLVTKTSFARLR